jgi:hypothetical protein
MQNNGEAKDPHKLGFNGPPDASAFDGAPIKLSSWGPRSAHVCDDGVPLRFPNGEKMGARPSMFVAFLVYALAWLRSAVLDILAIRMPRRPYYSRPMPMIASLTGGADFTLAASMHGRRRGGPQVFGGSWNWSARCERRPYLPSTVVVVTPGFAEVRSRTGEKYLVQDGWIAKRRDAMQRSASLTFGRPRTRTSKA